MAVAATGFFDGVHSGHRAVLREIIRQAEDRGTESAVVTFWPHPRFILHRDEGALRLLNTIEEKKELLKASGIDSVYVMPFTEEFSRMSAESFIREYLMGRYSVDTLVIGYDHRLGRENISGDDLVFLAQKCGLDVCVVSEEAVAGSHVSSTVIRNSIADGDFRNASRLLGYDYNVRCKVMSSSEQETVLVPADRCKAFPCPAKYRILLNGIGYGCEVIASSVLVYGMINLNEQDVKVTFLEKL